MKHSLNKGKVREIYLRQFSGRENGRKTDPNQHKYLSLVLGNTIVQMQYETQ